MGNSKSSLKMLGTLACFATILTFNYLLVLFGYDNPIAIANMYISTSICFIIIACFYSIHFKDKFDRVRSRVKHSHSIAMTIVILFASISGLFVYVSTQLAPLDSRFTWVCVVIVYISLFIALRALGYLIYFYKIRNIED